MKNLIPLLLVAGAGYLVWNWYANSQAAAAAAAAPVPTGGGASPPPPIIPPTIAPPTPKATPSAWVQAAQVMIAQAGPQPSLNWDQWSYYWQNSPTFAGAPFGFGVNGSISPAMFQTILYGANHTDATSAQQFVTNMQAAVTTLGLGGYRHRRFA